MQTELLQFAMHLTGHGEEDIEQMYNDWLNSPSTPSFAPFAEAWKQHLQQRIDELRKWKAEAMEVMKDISAIGKALGVPLGQSIHDKILSAIQEMKQGEWISIKDRLPDYDEPVLWLFEHGIMMVDALDKDGNPHLLGSGCEVEGFELAPATHWMPLPPPPTNQK